MEIDIQMISEILYESLMHPLTMAPLLGINLVLGAVIGVLVNVVGKVMGEGKTIDEVAHRTDGPYEMMEPLTASRSIPANRVMAGSLSMLVMQA